MGSEEGPAISAGERHEQGGERSDLSLRLEELEARLHSLRRRTGPSADGRPGTAEPPRTPEALERRDPPSTQVMPARTSSGWIDQTRTAPPSAEALPALTDPEPEPAAVDVQPTPAPEPETLALEADPRPEPAPPAVEMDAASEPEQATLGFASEAEVEAARFASLPVLWESERRERRRRKVLAATVTCVATMASAAVWWIVPGAAPAASTEVAIAAVDADPVRDREQAIATIESDADVLHRESQGRVRVDFGVAESDPRVAVVRLAAPTEGEALMLSAALAEAMAERTRDWQSGPVVDRQLNVIARMTEVEAAVVAARSSEADADELERELALLRAEADVIRSELDRLESGSQVLGEPELASTGRVDRRALLALATFVSILAFGFWILVRSRIFDETD